MIVGDNTLAPEYYIFLGNDFMNFKRLSTEDDFNKYSDRIKEFESEFDYPLGEKKHSKYLMWIKW